MQEVPRQPFELPGGTPADRHAPDSPAELVFQRQPGVEQPEPLPEMFPQASAAATPHKHEADLRPVLEVRDRPEAPEAPSETNSPDARREVEPSQGTSALRHESWPPMAPAYRVFSPEGDLLNAADYSDYIPPRVTVKFAGETRLTDDEQGMLRGVHMAAVDVADRLNFDVRPHIPDETRYHAFDDPAKYQRACSEIGVFVRSNSVAHFIEGAGILLNRAAALDQDVAAAIAAHEIGHELTMVNARLLGPGELIINGRVIPPVVFERPCVDTSTGLYESTADMLGAAIMRILRIPLHITYSHIDALLGAAVTETAYRTNKPASHEAGKVIRGVIAGEDGFATMREALGRPRMEVIRRVRNDSSVAEVEHIARTAGFTAACDRIADLRHPQRPWPADYSPFDWGTPRLA